MARLPCLDFCWACVKFNLHWFVRGPNVLPGEEGQQSHGRAASPAGASAVHATPIPGGAHQALGVALHRLRKGCDPIPGNGADCGVLRPVLLLAPGWSEAVHPAAASQPWDLRAAVNTNKPVTPEVPACLRFKVPPWRHLSHEQSQQWPPWLVGAGPGKAMRGWWSPWLCLGRWVPVGVQASLS